MKTYLKAGWESTKGQSFIIAVLFIYELLWGALLYKFVQSLLTPLLHRFPGNDLDETSVHLFLAESQFQLTKTDVSHVYLWSLLAFCLARMLLSPMINAGLYYSIHIQGPQGAAFIEGVREKFKPFLVLYWVRIGVTLTPLYWIVPWLSGIVRDEAAHSSVLWTVSPVLGGYLLFGGFVHLCFMYMQWSRITGHTLPQSLIFLVRRLFAAVGITFMVGMIALLVAVVILSLSILWAGIIALVLHQLYQLLRIFLKVWEIAAQYHLWQSK
ncbi:MAG TPA: hypothetical protein VGE40_01160 [Bacilli bacterium]